MSEHALPAVAAPPPYRWGGDGQSVSDYFLLLSGNGEYCAGCGHVAFVQHLKKHRGHLFCPDCRPRFAIPLLRFLTHRH